MGLPWRCGVPLPAAVEFPSTTSRLAKEERHDRMHRNNGHLKIFEEREAKV